MCTLEDLCNVAMDVEKDVNARRAKGEKGYLGGTGILAEALLALRLKCEICRRKLTLDLEPNALKRKFNSSIWEVR